MLRFVSKETAIPFCSVMSVVWYISIMRLIRKSCVTFTLPIIFRVSANKDTTTIGHWQPV